MYSVRKQTDVAEIIYTSVIKEGVMLIFKVHATLK